MKKVPVQVHKAELLNLCSPIIFIYLFNILAEL